MQPEWLTAVGVFLGAALGSIGTLVVRLWRAKTASRVAVMQFKRDEMREMFDRQSAEIKTLTLRIDEVLERERQCNERLLTLERKDARRELIEAYLAKTDANFLRLMLDHNLPPAVTPATIPASDVIKPPG